MSGEADRAFVLSWRHRLWLRLGYGFKGSDEFNLWRDDDRRPEWSVPGTLLTVTYIHVGWLDRLRLLLTGHAVLETATRTDLENSRAESRSAFAVLAPAARTALSRAAGETT